MLSWMEIAHRTLLSEVDNRLAWLIEPQTPENLTPEMMASAIARQDNAIIKDIALRFVGKGKRFASLADAVAWRNEFKSQMLAHLHYGQSSLKSSAIVVEKRLGRTGNGRKGVPCIGIRDVFFCDRQQDSLRSLGTERVCFHRSAVSHLISCIDLSGKCRLQCWCTYYFECSTAGRPLLI